MAKKTPKKSTGSSTKKRRVPGSSSNSVYTEIGKIARFIPLGMDYCYLNDPRNGKNYHLQVNSPSFHTRLEEIAAEWGSEKVTLALTEMAQRYPGGIWSSAAAEFSARAQVLTQE